MTDADLIKYYSDLLIMQYRGKPKAKAHVEALVKLAIMGQIIKSIENAFDIDTAIGVQLDVLGKYQNVNRTSYNPTTQVFSLLNDSDFRLLIKFAIIRNNFKSDLFSIQSIFFQYFGNDVKVFDYAEMRMSYYIDTDLVSLNLINAISYQGLLPRPMGVTISPTIYASITDQYFGMRTYQIAAQKVNPFNTYGSYITTWPWLSYTNTFI